MPGALERESASNWMAHARARLTQRRAEKPVTKAGQIWALWPEIEAALAVGQGVRSICMWLEADAGIKLSVTSLTFYISRIRRREKANLYRDVATDQSVRSYCTESIGRVPAASLSEPPPGGSNSDPAGDPLAQAMRVLSRPKMATAGRCEGV